jgi:hypothetical protein
MAFRALRRTSAEIDEQHLAESDRSASRRRFLTRAATGGALAVGASALPLSSLVPGASAQTEEGGEPTEGTTPGTLPTAPEVTGDPPVVEGNDLTLVVFLQSIELTAVDAYGVMVDTGKLAPALAETARQFKVHHDEHAEALGTIAGGASVTDPNPGLTAELTPLIESATSQEDLATFAYTLEERITATYAAALGALESWQAAGIASRILPVDSQHAVVWSQVIEPDPTEWATEITTWIPNFQSATDAIDIIQYPAG